MKLSADRMGPHVARAMGMTADDFEGAFRPAVSEDLPSVIRLRQSLKGDQILWDDEKYLMWRFFDNSRMVSGAIPYWVFVKDGEIIAGLGLEHVRIALDGEIHAVVRCIDVMVHPQYDGLGLGAFMNLVILEHYPVVIAIDTNEQSTNMVSRMFTRLNDVPRFTIICRLGPLLRQRFGFGFLSNAAGLMGDRIISLKRRVKRNTLPDGIHIRALNRFEEDVLTLNNSASWADKILSIRDEKHLNWRFVLNPKRDYRILGAFRGDRMVGYVAICSIPTDSEGIARGRIADWLYQGSNSSDGAEIMRVLFESAVDSLNRDGVHVINVLASDLQSQEALQKTGFRKRGDGCPFFVQAGSDDLKSRLTHSEKWFLTGYDNDVE